MPSLDDHQFGGGGGGGNPIFDGSEKLEGIDPIDVVLAADDCIDV